MKCYNATNERGVGMPLSEEARQRKNAYNREYQRNKVDTRKRKQYAFRMRQSDEEIIKWLDSQENLTGYLRDLILADMKKSRG